MGQSIVIKPYRETWPQEFQQVGLRLRKALGEQAIAVHHIGSTSVPGLAAKDIIDVQVTVAGLDASLIPLFDAAGFNCIEEIRGDHCPAGIELAPGQSEKRFFYQPDPRVNVHVRVEGRFNQRYALVFRDYLRTHATAAAAYGEIKRQLAMRFPADQDAYYDIKDPACDLILAAALEWSYKTGWNPPGTDA